MSFQIILFRWLFRSVAILLLKTGNRVQAIQHPSTSVSKTHHVLSQIDEQSPAWTPAIVRTTIFESDMEGALNKGLYGEAPLHKI